VRGEEPWKSGRHVMSDLGHVFCENSPISASQPLPVGGLVLDITCLSTYLHLLSRHGKVHPSTKEHAYARILVGPTTNDQTRHDHDHAVNLTIPMF
jgi:hypothetical protein